jgi:hypothetical protein
LGAGRRAGFAAAGFFFKGRAILLFMDLVPGWAAILAGGGFLTAAFFATAALPLSGRAGALAAALVDRLTIFAFAIARNLPCAPTRI